MLRCLVWLLATTPALAFAGSGAAMSWSPDGRWVAYTVSFPRERATPPTGWLFDGASDAGTASPGRYRIEAVDAESGVVVVLEESANVLTSPAWSPDGKSLAFGRVVDHPNGPTRFELIIQDAPGQNRVVVSEKMGDKATIRSDWTRLSPSWSPDGRYLAIPDLTLPSGISVLEVVNGRRLKSFEGSSPAWSPDGTRIAFLRTERTSSLLVVEIGLDSTEKGPSQTMPELTFGPPRHLLDLGLSDQAPVWARDGKSIAVSARRLIVRRPGPSLLVDLLRVRVDNGSVETTHLNVDPLDQEKTVRGICSSQDRDLNELFYSLDIEGQPATIVWCRPRTQETVDRFNPVDFTLKIGALAFSPDGKTLAIRFGDPETSATTALFDVSTRRLTLVAPDDASRRAWITQLIATARRLLQVGLPPAAVEGRPVSRPTILPVPGEIPANREILVRLLRLGRLGRPLCDPPHGGAGTGPELEPTASVAFDEARLFFDALREDYSAALNSLQSLESRTASSDHRERLLAVRAQLFLGLGDVDRASDTIRFLQTLEDSGRSRVESTTAGTILTREPVATNGWARYLAARLDDLKKTIAGKTGGDDDPTLNSNPAPPRLPLAPAPNVPFERLPNGVFVIPQNGFRRPPLQNRLPNNVPVRVFPPRPFRGPQPAPPAPVRPPIPAR